MSEFLQLFSDIRSGEVAKVNDLLATDSSLINKFMYGVTPLMYSIECQNEEISLELVKSSGLDLTLTDNLGSGYLEKAVEYRMYKIVEALCPRVDKAIINGTVMDTETLLTHSIKIDDLNTSLALINGNGEKNNFFLFFQTSVGTR
jgi:hypothetical protein